MQERWNDYGRTQLADIQKNPAQFTIDAFPGAQLTSRQDMLRSLSPLRDKRILDLGCGRGEAAVWFAKHGATVSAIDVGSALIDAARELAHINDVACDFRVADIVSLPFRSDKFDAVTGLGILHHLTPDNARRAVRECHRVLRPDGAAYFNEPIENSRVFDFLQNLIPAGGKHPRPSILMRSQWRAYLAVLDDRAMSDSELRGAGSCFADVRIQHYGLAVRLARLIGKRHKPALLALDAWLLRHLPTLGRYSQSALVTYRK